MKKTIGNIKYKIKALINKSKKTIPVYIPIYHNELLNNRVALITGGTSGIGLAIAKAFLNAGATVVITSRSQAKVDLAVSKLKLDCNKENDKIFGIKFDISNVSEFKNKFNELKSLLGNKQLDILVNNAGILTSGTFSEVTPEDFDLVYDTNLKGVYFLSQLISKDMIKNKVSGNILNIASSSSLRPATSPYTLSKWGIRGLTLGLAKTLAPYQIVVNGLAPGPTATPMLMSRDNADLTHNKLPTQRFATPEEIANFAVILVSDLSRTIIGDIVYMTGGAGNLTLDDINYKF